MNGDLPHRAAVLVANAHAVRALLDHPRFIDEKHPVIVPERRANLRVQLGDEWLSRPGTLPDTML